MWETVAVAALGWALGLALGYFTRVAWVEWRRGVTCLSRPELTALFRDYAALHREWDRTLLVTEAASRAKRKAFEAAHPELKEGPLKDGEGRAMRIRRIVELTIGCLIGLALAQLLGWR